MRTFAATLCLLMASAVGAQGTPGAGYYGYGADDGGFPADPYYVASPDQLIRQGLDRLLGFLMGSRDPTPETVRQFVELEIAPYFDFAYMAQWASGPLQHRLDQQQRMAMTAKLRRLFLDALSRHLGTLERPLPRVDVFPARPGQSTSEARVYARVLPEGRPPARLEFRFYWSAEGWKVYDVVANGASAVGFYRTYFTTALRRYGPDAVLR
jgi:phospholipid transport system substrate-binding protein